MWLLPESTGEIGKVFAVIAGLYKVKFSKRNLFYRSGIVLLMVVMMIIVHCIGSLFSKHDWNYRVLCWPGSIFHKMCFCSRFRLTGQRGGTDRNNIYSNGNSHSISS